MVTNEKLRFDFSHQKPISSELIKEIENEVNYRILCNDKVTTKVMSPDKAIEKGAIALFGEKYGDEVRVVSIGKSIDNEREAWSVELCGGTHVKNTSEISTFKILSETGVSSGVRRIEALTNMAAIKYYNNEIDKIRYISSSLKTNSTQVTKKIEQLVSENQKMNKELKFLKNKSHLNYDNNSTKETLNGIVFEYRIYDDLKVKELNLGNQVDFKLIDYREINEKFDRIVSVGMFEHVGRKYYQKFFNQVAKLLNEDGAALIHTIGSVNSPRDPQPWINKYIFPGGYTPSLSEVASPIENSGLIITDLEVLRMHYAHTLRHWKERFLLKKDQVLEMFDERFMRMWEFYLASCEMAFKWGDQVVFQLQLTKKLTSVPNTRDYIY